MTVDARVLGRSVDVAGITDPSLRNGPLDVFGWKSRYCSPTGDRLRTLTTEFAGILSREVITAFASTPSAVSRICSTLPIFTPR
jgi:hypothetical protein